MVNKQKKQRKEKINNEIVTFGRKYVRNKSKITR
jgi:hypothetical protein